MPVSLRKPSLDTDTLELTTDMIVNDSFQSMSGDFSQWTLSDCDWYHRQLGWDFKICGDTHRIVAIELPFGWAIAG